MSLKVIKIGGSLLHRSTLVEDLRRWLDRTESDTPRALVVGGGRRVDELRRRWRARELSDAEAHWNAVGIMDANVRRLARDLPTDVTASFPRLGRLNGAGATCFAPGRFLREDEPRQAGQRLPIGWSVTSDSIAARIAVLLNAELALIKSAPLPTGVAPNDFKALARVGYVDEHFPSASLTLRRVEFQTLD